MTHRPALSSSRTASLTRLLPLAIAFCIINFDPPSHLASSSTSSSSRMRVAVAFSTTTTRTRTMTTTTMRGRIGESRSTNAPIPSKTTTTTTKTNGMIPSSSMMDKAGGENENDGGKAGNGDGRSRIRRMGGGGDGGVGNNRRRRFLQRAHDVATPADRASNVVDSADSAAGIRGIGSEAIVRPPVVVRAMPASKMTSSTTSTAKTNANARTTTTIVGGARRGVSTTKTTTTTTTRGTISKAATGATTKLRPPLRTGKSIEELEDILARRWGTATSSKTSSVVGGGKGDEKSSDRKSGGRGGGGRRDGTISRTGDDDDVDRDDDFGSDEDVPSMNIEYEAVDDTWSSSSSSSSPSMERRRNRGRAVVDPWATDDDGKDLISDPPAPVPAAMSPRERRRMQEREERDRRDALVDRVRLNQERLRRSRQQHDVRSTRNDNDDRDIDNYDRRRSSIVPPAVDVIPRDYYDEDDEGYEGMYGGGGVGLVSPRPAGGTGRRGGGGGVGSSPSSSSSLSSRGGGIFSNRQVTNNMNSQRDDGGRRGRREVQRRREGNDSPMDERRRGGDGISDGGRGKIEAGSSQNDDDDIDENVPVKKRKREVRLAPLRDDDGSEMFLTLEQADKIVKSIISSSASSSSSSLLKDGSTVPHQDMNEDCDVIPVVNRWEDIGITDPNLLRNLRSPDALSCPCPLPVQDRACPAIVSMNDVLVSTHTGSGKTLAFLAPIAQGLLMDGDDGGGRGDGVGSGAYPRAMIVAPGRELASQIVSVARTLFVDTGLSVELAIGGTPYSRNVEKLRKMRPDVLVGTPGRIAELVIGRPGDKGGKLKISGLRTIVLDEFDALLQYDAHVEPTVAIMQALDRQHGRSLQRVLCSATASDVIQTSTSSPISDKKVVSSAGVNIESYLRPGYAHASVDKGDPLVTSGVRTLTKGGAVATSARVSRTTIHGTLHVPSRRLALEAVRKILNTEPAPQQALIFVDSPRRVDIVIEKLAQMDIVAAPLHGGTTSGKGDRAEVNKALREGYVGIVVATEMAARGIDAPYLTHCINLDLPTDASHYAHRAGRCGRGGRPGVSISITCDVRERGVPKRFAEELGITMYNVEAREGKLRIVDGQEIK
ncbi:hypothetical protein ACHAXA_004594 [Cyclostephanos tholiformis]|uniref:RNA helicase n=1 Tax=Cyclostephanos tholiformis TaxID=382380 RepID=A0ABD3SPH6_9STRA